MSTLIAREDVEEILKSTEELDAYAFKILDEKLSEVPVRAVIRDCNGCMGASFGDCKDCEHFKVSVRGKVEKALSGAIDKFDAHIDGLPERLREWRVWLKHKLFNGKHKK